MSLALKDEHFSENVLDIEQFKSSRRAMTDVIKSQVRLGLLEGKTIVDLGCGHGWSGQAFQQYGAEVMYVDGREEHLAEVRRRNPTAWTVWADIEHDELPCYVELVLCLGLIYHIADPAALFRKLAKITDRVVIETTALDHDGECIVFLDEPSTVKQYSITGRACRPSPGWVVRELKAAGFEHVRDLSEGRLNSNPFQGGSGALYDWSFRRTCGWRRGEFTLRKLYIATKNSPDELIRG